MGSSDHSPLNSRLPSLRRRLGRPAPGERNLANPTPASALFLPACATRPQETQTVPTTPSVPVQPQQPRGLIGMTPSDLMHHFGPPAMQIREGTSLKLQFRGRACVLDAYLYPSANGSG